MQECAEKMQTAAAAGDQNAKEWLLDVKQIALDIKDEQMQVNSLLQAIHGFVANVSQAPPPAPQQQGYAPPPPGDGPPVYGQQGGYGRQGGGMMSGFLNSGFDWAVEMGAGIGLGQEMINSIF